MFNHSMQRMRASPSGPSQSSRRQRLSLTADAERLPYRKDVVKTYLQAWWRGIGVFGLHICLSVVAGAIGLVGEMLPEGLQFPVGLPIFIIVAPPALFWTFRWLYPELAAAKTRFSRERRGS